MRVVILFILVSLFAVSALGQPVGSPRNDSVEENRRVNLERRMANMRLADRLARLDAQEGREYMPAGTYRPILTKKFSKKMEVDEDLQREFGDILTVPGSGIIKLFPQKDCGETTDAKKIGECLQYNTNIREYANGFSFRESKRSVFAKSDIALGRGYIFSSLHSVQTILVKLDDLKLVDASLDSPGITFLAEFSPGSSEILIDEDYVLFKNGLTFRSDEDGTPVQFNYGKIAKIETGMTYGLRSISYRPVGSPPLPKDFDVIVVFTVVSVEKSGAITIVWRELRRTNGLEMLSTDTPESTT